jgi:hypothetical protein
VDAHCLVHVDWREIEAYYQPQELGDGLGDFCSPVA